MRVSTAEIQAVRAQVYVRGRALQGDHRGRGGMCLRERGCPVQGAQLCPFRALCVQSHLSRVRLFATPWTAPRQAPLSMGFSRQEYWSRLPCPPPGDLPHPGTEPASLTSACIGRRFFTTGATWEAAQIKHTHRHANWSSLQVQRRPTPPSPCLGAPTCRDQPAGRPSCSPSNLCRLSLGLTSASPVAV